jgi:hypothetical protein
VGGAEEEAREAQRDVAGVGAGAEFVPGGEAGAGLGGGEVTQAGELGVGTQAEQGGAASAMKGTWARAATAAQWRREGDVGGVGAEVEGSAQQAVGLTAEAGVGAVVDEVVESAVGDVGGGARGGRRGRRSCGRRRGGAGFAWGNVGGQ